MKNNHRHDAEVITKEFVVGSHSYYVCKDNEGMYWGIDYKLLNDSEAKINGINGNMSETLNDTLQKCWLNAMVDDMKIDMDKAFKDNDEAEKARLYALVCESESIYA